MKRFKYAAVFLLLLAVGARATDNDSTRPRAFLGATSAGEYRLGDRGPGGGFIFYLFPAGEGNGLTGLEVSPEDLGKARLGVFTGLFHPEAMEIAIGRGGETTSLLAGAAHTGYDTALARVRAYRGGGMADWYLPTRQELDALYNNLVRLGGGLVSMWQTLKRTSGPNDRYRPGRFTMMTPYWSCSMHSTGHAWGRLFDRGYHVLNSGEGQIAAVRSF